MTLRERFELATGEKCLEHLSGEYENHPTWEYVEWLEDMILRLTEE